MKKYYRNKHSNGGTEMVRRSPYHGLVVRRSPYHRGLVRIYPYHGRTGTEISVPPSPALLPSDVQVWPRLISPSESSDCFVDEARCGPHIGGRRSLMPTTTRLKFGSVALHASISRKALPTSCSNLTGSTRWRRPHLPHRIPESMCRNRV